MLSRSVSKKAIGETENNTHILTYQKKIKRLKAAGIDSAKAVSEAVLTESKLSVQISRLRKIEEQLPDTEETVRVAEEELLACRENLTEIR